MKHWLLSGDPVLIKQMMQMPEEERVAFEEKLTAEEVAQAKDEIRQLAEFKRQCHRERGEAAIVPTSSTRVTACGLVEEIFDDGYDPDDEPLLIEFADGGILGMEELPS